MLNFLEGHETFLGIVAGLLIGLFVAKVVLKAKSRKDPARDQLPTPRFLNLWPKIHDKKTAELAVHQGILGGILSIIITTIIFIAPLFGVGKPIAYASPSAILGQILLMIILVIGLAAKSRISACAIVIYFILCKISLAFEYPQFLFSTWFMGIVFTLAFITGARGTFAYWKYSETKPKRFSWKLLLGFIVTFYILVFTFSGSQAPSELSPDQKSTIDKIEALIKDGQFDEAMKLSNESFVDPKGIPISDEDYYSINRRMNIGKGAPHLQNAQNLYAERKYDEALKETEEVLTWFGSGNTALGVSKADLDSITSNTDALIKSYDVLNGKEISEIQLKIDEWVNDKWSDKIQKAMFSQYAQADFLRQVLLSITKHKLTKKSL